MLRTCLTAARDLVTWGLALALVVGLVSLAVAGPSPRAAGEPVSEVIFPEQELPLRFSHVQHLGQLDLECVDCHEGATTSRSSLDRLVPGEAVCRQCHAIDRSQQEKPVAVGEPPARCVACHVSVDPRTGEVPRVRIPAPNLRFSHAAHVGRGMACQGCHGDLAAEGVALATRAQLPSMKLCLSCHDGARAADECTTCHLADAGGTVKTEYQSGTLVPSGALRGDAHDMSFRASHRFAAQNDQDYCESCHREQFCIDCHDGATKPMDFHVGDYVSLHAVDARRNSPDCSGCHRLQSFCVGCHSRSGVAADGKGSEFAPPASMRTGPRFHPAGWVDYDDGLQRGGRGADHHSFAAQRNIRQCASCHRETFCTTCHTAEIGSPRVSPHPRGWLGSRRCKALAARAGRMCLRCHVDERELDCDRPM